MQRIADPRLLARSSRPSLSAFQVRESDGSTQRTQRQPSANERVYILALVIFLLAATGVLTYFFLVS